MLVRQVLHTDVLIVGGTTSAVQLAITERKRGRSVLIITGFTYFGEEQCAYLNCGTHSPMQIKRKLDRLVIEHRIDFRFRMWPLKMTEEAFFFGSNEGILAVQAGMAVDFTANASLARLSGMPFQPFQPGKRPFTRRVLDLHERFMTLKGTVELRGDSITELEEAEQDARALTWSSRMSLSADFCGMDFRPMPMAPDPVRRVFLPQQLPGLLRLIPYEPKNCVELGALPVLEQVDVLIVGGGTAGAPAGIAVGRQGVRALIIEELAHPGGLGTEGRIASYCHGYPCGFSQEVDQGVRELQGDSHPDLPDKCWSVECKQYYWERELRRSGTTIWYQYTCCGVIHDGPTIQAGIVAGPFGSGLIRAKQFMDCTGNANLAAFCGAPTRYAGDDEPAVQGAGMSLEIPNRDYMNTDYMFTVDSSNADTARAFIVARDRFPDGFDLCRLPGTRERRCIVGEIFLTPADFYLHQPYPDALYVAESNFDTHGFVVDPFLLFQPPDRTNRIVQVPLRALLSPAVSNLLTTGLGISAHRDAMPLIRMQRDVQNQGYAAGLVAAMAVKEGKTPRELDPDAIHRKLVELNILPPEVMERDCDPKSEDVNARIFQKPNFEQLHQDFQVCPDSEKAIRLALLGDEMGKQLLEDQLAGTEDWDLGWNFTGMGQFGTSASRLDVAIMAWANISADHTPLTMLLKALTPDTEFSHIRACCYFLIRHPAPNCSQLLESLLVQFDCHAIQTWEGLLNSPYAGTEEVTERNLQLKELYLASALHECQPDNKIAKDFLSQYHTGMHRFYASYAEKFL